MGFLYRPLKDKVPWKANKIIHTEISRPILFNGNEKWNINKNMKKITAAYIKVIKITNGVTRMDKIRNLDLCKRIHVLPMAEEILEPPD